MCSKNYCWRIYIITIVCGAISNSASSPKDLKARIQLPFFFFGQHPTYIIPLLWDSKEKVGTGLGHIPAFHALNGMSYREGRKEGRKRINVTKLTRHIGLAQLVRNRFVFYKHENSILVADMRISFVSDLANPLKCSLSLEVVSCL